MESPLDKIGTGTSLSFDIELTRPACPGDILFEADAPYGTLDIRVMDNGKLGFTRELYNYYFDYKLPVGKKVHVEIVTATQKTTLKVDGETIGEATGSFYNEFAKRVTKDGIGNSTFTLPLAAHRLQDSAVSPPKSTTSRSRPPRRTSPSISTTRRSGRPAPTPGPRRASRPVAT